MKQFEINEKNEGQRLDKFLSRILKNAGNPFIYKMLRKKNITLNDKKADGNAILNAGDIVKLYFSDETYEKFAGSKTHNELTDSFPFKSLIIYEDDNIILINKPAGILSQKAKDDDVSMNEYVLSYMLSEKKITDDDINSYKPSVVNRLDRNTSGIIIAAKNLKAATLISQGLKDRTIQKYYKCAVAGHFDKEGLHKGYLVKDGLHNTVSVYENIDDIHAAEVFANYNSNYNNKCNNIETEYELIKDCGDYSVLSVHLLTGRSHQIRAHLAHLGYPIIGDMKYGNRDINKKFNKNKQLLHAYKIIFPKYEDEIFKNISGKTFVCDIDLL